MAVWRQLANALFGLGRNDQITSHALCAKWGGCRVSPRKDNGLTDAKHFSSAQGIGASATVDLDMTSKALMVAFCGVLSCGGGHQAEPPRPATASPEAPQSSVSRTPASGQCFVGRLAANKKTDHINPGGYCLDGTYYRGAPFRVSRINLFGSDDLDDDWHGRYVQVEAKLKDNLIGRLQVEGSCDDGDLFPVQARDDWAPAEGSTLTTPERLAQARYLEASSRPRLIDLVTVEAHPEPSRRHKHWAPPEDESAQVIVTVHNPFDFELRGLQLIVHYEGGPGKPMPHYETVDIDPLAPGGSFTSRRPAAIEKLSHRKEPAWWHFSSVAVEGSSGPCVFLPATLRR